MALSLMAQGVIQLKQTTKYALRRLLLSFTNLLAFKIYCVGILKCLKTTIPTFKYFFSSSPSRSQHYSMSAANTGCQLRRQLLQSD